MSTLSELIQSISFLNSIRKAFMKVEPKEINSDLRYIYDVFKHWDIPISHMTDNGIKYVTDERIILKDIGSQNNHSRFSELFDSPIIFANDYPFNLFTNMAEKADLLSDNLRKKLLVVGVSKGRCEIEPQSGDLILGQGNGKYYISNKDNLSTLRDYYRLLVEIKELIERETGKRLSIE